MKIFGEELVIKMWESFIDKGIGGILKPAQDKRIERARIEIRREELLLIAQAEVDAKKIATGEAVYIDGKIKLISNSPDYKEEGRIEPLIGNLNISNLAANSIMSESIQKEVNIAKAMIHAEQELSESEAYESSSDIEKDWLFSWRENAGRVSSEALQTLWGKVLAGEVKQPGSYSMRTMEFLKCITKAEAELIEKVASFVFGDVIYKKINKSFEQKALKFTDFMKLQSIGLLSGVEAIGLQATYESLKKDRFLIYLFSNTKIIILSDPDAEKKFSTEVYSVTPLGKEIFRLSGANIDSNYLEDIARSFLEEVKTVIIADYFKDEHGNGQYANEIEIKALEKEK